MTTIISGSSPSITFSDSTTQTSASYIGANGSLYENNQSITSNYTITAGRSAMSTGPVTIQSGVTFQIPSGSRYVIL